jgi:ATP-dependent DNA ligase
MTFPILFKKASSGAIQQWRIWVEGATIVTEHGQVGGALQVGRDTLKEGKNAGKKNATTAEQQAEAEALAKWTKKQARERYVIELERAQAGETDAKGGIAPMLAQTYQDIHPKNLRWPYHGQRKFNGVRLVVEIRDGEVSLWSRRQMPYLGVPHIKAAYEKAFADVQGYFRFDGELYRHGWSLQRISGYARKEKTKPGFEQLGHFVYDMPDGPGGGIERPWHQRKYELDALFETYLADLKDIHPVETFLIENEEQLRAYHDVWVKEGYEGVILRGLDGGYAAGKRAIWLIKFKLWKDLEFPIVGVHEGRGKFEGLAMFTCRTVEGRDPGAPLEFDCCAPGGFADRAEYLRRGAELIGKQFTVKFFEWTETNRPEFPIGMAVRDYE